MTVGEWLALATDKLASTGVESANADAEIIAAHVLGKTRSEVFAHPEWQVNAEATVLLERRIAGEPIAYILGYREFYGRRFAVDKRVLIPRPETEVLVEHSVKSIPEGATVWDVGVGSGSIAISLAIERSDIRVIASDVSLNALEVAHENAISLGACVQLVRADGLTAARDGSLGAVVSNPPYVKPGDPLLEDSVRRFEPAVALFSDGGLGFISRLVIESDRALRPGGVLILEFGLGQSLEVVELLHRFERVELVPDLSGRDRLAIAWKPTT